MKILILVLFALGVCFAQRPSYAGNRAIGYPHIEATTTPTTTSASTTTDPSSTGLLRDGFAGNTMSSIATVTTTTERLPIEANGDRNLVERLSQLPLEYQPFWLLNWRYLEQHRTQPQSYSPHRNYFIDFASSPNRQNNFKR